MRKSEIATLTIAFLAFLAGIIFYPTMPEEMPTHWNQWLEPDDYGSKSEGLFLPPIILLGLALLFIAIPRIDPLKRNYEKFRKQYDLMVVLLSLFVFFVYIYTILWTLGVKIPFSIIVPIGLGTLFFIMGIVCEHAKQNWFVGIRTPWTLSSERVWDKTHRIGGKLFKIAGVVIVLGYFFQGFFHYFILVPTILIAIYTILYSYIEYQKENRDGA